MSLIPIMMILLVMGVTNAYLPSNIDPIRESTNFYDYSDYHLNYHDSPIELNAAALLFDRMNFQKDVNKRGLKKKLENEMNISHKDHLMNIDGSLSRMRQSQMDLSKRHDDRSSVYWRCYFNAVTCFKKK